MKKSSKEPYKIKSSGKKRKFDTGAQRDSGDNKSRPDLMSPFALMRIGKRFKEGADTYGEGNWEKGMPFTQLIASASRHLLEYMMGDRSEDHLSAAIWNIQAIIHFEEVGRDELDDMPDFKKKSPRDRKKS